MICILAAETGVSVVSEEALAVPAHEVNNNEEPSRVAAIITHQTLPETAPDGLT
jgi:hypothetical protein